MITGGENDYRATLIQGAIMSPVDANEYRDDSLGIKFQKKLLDTRITDFH